MHDDDCEDQALCPTEHCTVCRPAFINNEPIYPQLVKRGRFWCCVACGRSYGEHPHPDLK
jgi:hypothetical protein